VPGATIEIEYDNQYIVKRIRVRPPALTSHAISFNFPGVSLSTDLNIAKSQPTALRHARWHSWLPKIKFEITLVLFNRYQLSTSVGDVSVPESLATDTYESDRELSATAPSAQNGGYGTATASGATPS
jgi:hypothetical protein